MIGRSGPRCDGTRSSRWSSVLQRALQCSLAAESCYAMHSLLSLLGTVVGPPFWLAEGWKQITGGIANKTIFYHEYLPLYKGLFINKHLWPNPLIR